jgi:DNA modification methylase
MKNIIRFGGASEVICELREESTKRARCLVTSPPYWNQRNYGGGFQEIGQEKTTEHYLANLTQTLRDCGSLLTRDATMWVNIGDVYHKGSPLGLHWRMAFAMPSFGWTLRQEIIWHKPKVMPEAVKNRCTKAHEYLMVFARTGEEYYWNKAGMREEGVIPAGTKGAKGSVRRSSTAKVNSRPPRYHVYDGFRNRRSVWSINPKPYKGAHFATFPPELIKPIIETCSEKGDYVFDPFLGSGTTAMVANELGRSCIGIELNEEFDQLIKGRLGVVG